MMDRHEYGTFLFLLLDKVEDLEARFVKVERQIGEFRWVVDHARDLEQSLANDVIGEAVQLHWNRLYNLADDIEALVKVYAEDDFILIRWGVTNWQILKAFPSVLKKMVEETLQTDYGLYDSIWFDKMAETHRTGVKAISDLVAGQKNYLKDWIDNELSDTPHAIRSEFK